MKNELKQNFSIKCSFSSVMPISTSYTTIFNPQLLCSMFHTRGSQQRGRGTQGCRKEVRGVPPFISFQWRFGLFLYLGVPPNADFTYGRYSKTSKAVKHCSIPCANNTEQDFTYQTVIEVNSQYLFFMSYNPGCQILCILTMKLLHKNHIEQAKVATGKIIQCFNTANVCLNV